MSTIKKILAFIRLLLPFIPKSKEFNDALNEVDRRRPLEKESSWRDKL